MQSRRPGHETVPLRSGSVSTDVDDFFEAAGGWRDELVAMRPVLLGTGLDEQLKWRQPCYSLDGHNIVIMGAMKAGMTLGFFKGMFMSDPDGVLVDNGPNSRSVRRMFFTSVDEVTNRAEQVVRYVAEAIRVEESGVTAGPAPEPEWVAELQVALDADAEFRAAFESLTPGRRRAYNLHFADAKQSSTRTARIERYRPKILDGKGLQDR